MIHSMDPGMFGDEPERLAERYASEDARADYDANNWRRFEWRAEPRPLDEAMEHERLSQLVLGF